MHSKKEDSSKVRKLKTTLSNTKEKSKDKTKTISKLRRQNRDLKISRDAWKGKSISNRLENKQLKAKLKRLGKPSRHQYDLKLIFFCVMLRLKGKCSYRSIRRILIIANQCFNLSMQRFPCANTVENWVGKMGYFQLENSDNRQLGEKVCLIVDESAGVGNEKVLLVLACSAKKEEGKPLSFGDAVVCYMHGQKSWNGEQVCEALSRVEELNGFKVSYVISDESSVMKKGVREYGKDHILDISHAIASCLRKTFEKDLGYISLTKLISGYQAKAVNRSLSYLRPPKQRTKARFMNIKPVLDWAQTVTHKLGKLKEEEREFFKDLSIHQPTMHLLRTCLELGEKIGLLLKNRGLSAKTIIEAKSEIGQYIDIEGKIARFSALLQQYLNKYEDIVSDSGKTFNACSDIIECLFGKYKAITSNNPYMGLSLVCLELPTYSISDKDMIPVLKEALSEVYVKDLISWNECKSTVNQASMRKMFFKKQ